MPTRMYVPKNFHALSLRLIEKANEIIAEYMADGYDMTLRQLYYQFVARGYLPNTEKSYNKMTILISDARLAGLVDWYAIVDRTRNLVGESHWASPASIVRSAAQGFQVDKWENQPNRVEVWIEKEALSGVLAAVCPGLDVDYFSCRGYVSQSEQWRAAQRLLQYKANGQNPIIIHLGDHDPSGIDMTRDIGERLFTFGINVEVNRIALNMDQVEAEQPPPNPAKVTDSRYATYRDQYGDYSWELDALPPSYLTNLITETVEGYRDQDLWDEKLQEETRGREELGAIADEYDSVVTRLTEDD